MIARHSDNEGWWSYVYECFFSCTSGKIFFDDQLHQLVLCVFVIEVYTLAHIYFIEIVKTSDCMGEGDMCKYSELEKSPCTNSFCLTFFPHLSGFCFSQFL